MLLQGHACSKAWPAVLQPACILHLNTTLQALLESQAEAEALRTELAAARARGSWLPGVAAFEALERKIAALEAAAGAPPPSRHLRQAATGMSEAEQAALQQQQLLLLQYQAVLAAKDAELGGFRQQVDDLLAAVRLLQQQ
jgi:hypothetical protein